MPKKAAKSITPENRMLTAEMVCVRALVHLSEEGQNYSPGEELQVSASRVAALGDHVMQVPASPAAEGGEDGEGDE